MAAALPLPKKRAVNGASGFTRRYGNSISARIGVVKRDGLDICIYKRARRAKKRGAEVAHRALFLELNLRANTDAVERLTGLKNLVRR